jgi:cytochrome c oxidase assembly protein subunit 15
MNSDPLGSDRGIAYWLFGCSALVFGMVSLGGLTRLTKSGLSMVEWKPTTFTPPRTEEEWMSEFRKYQLFPEYQRVNNQMSMDDFKFIYRMEFYHRLLGRTIGVAFAIPGVYFLVRGRLNRALGARLGLLFAAGGAQGAIGWWMVKSGLENPHATEQSGSVHVSPYRLATHLISAFAIYSLLFATALRVHPSTFSQTLPAGSAAHSAVRALSSHPSVRRLRTVALVATSVVFTTVFSGAFVAGNEAGLVYNEWPWMGGTGRLVPTDLIHPYLEPKWRNIFENSTAVQFDHRMLAYLTTGLVLASFAMTRRIRKLPEMQKLMEAQPLVRERLARMYTASHAWAGMVAVQVSLGITTLIMYVPVSLATVHQAGSLALLTISLWFVHTLREPSALPRGASLSTASLPHQLRQTLRDLIAGKVHRGTLYAAAALLLTVGVGQAAVKLTGMLKEEEETTSRQLNVRAIAQQQAAK